MDVSTDFKNGQKISRAFVALIPLVLVTHLHFGLTCYCKRRLIRVAGALLVLTSMTFKFACGS